jgi:DNA-binding MarR family transcriptional regulator
MNKVVAERDSVDERLAGWVGDLPGIDPEVEGIVERLQFLNRRIRRLLEETLAEFGLNLGEWKVLSSLVHAGEPHRSSPGALAKHEQLTTGAMTNRLDRLEAMGFVRRLPDEADRRGVVVELTDTGRDVWERSVGAQAAKERFVASALDESERRQLNVLLRRMVLHAEKQPVGVTID